MQILHDVESVFELQTECGCPGKEKRYELEVKQNVVTGTKIASKVNFFTRCLL